MPSLGRFLDHIARDLEAKYAEMQEAQNVANRLMLSYCATERVGILYHKNMRLTVCGIGGHATVVRTERKPSLHDFKSCLSHCLEHYLDGDHP